MNKRILLIEDDRAIGRLMQGNLQYEGFDVEWCETGRQAEEKVKQFVPHLVLLDLMLPAGVDGDPLVRFSFEGPLENSRAQKFVVTTSYGARGLIELIPGPAFNLLEVNFSTYDKPGMVRAGNFLLVKR